MITFDNIERAYERVRPVVHKTPLLSSRTFNTKTGNEVYFKAENYQRIGAFKFRGAYNKISSLTPEERSHGIVAHSSGNHAQGVALAGKLFSIKTVIVMPEDSVKSKVEGAKSYGAEIVFCGTSTDDRERVTDELIRKHGYALIHPYHDEKIMAGQGTLVLEIQQEIKDLDYLFVPVGGGGLISGCAVAAKNLFPGVKVIGVETDGANDCYQSFRSGKIEKLAKANTIADGMRTLSVGEMNFEIIRKYVDDVITISDDDIYPMMRFFIERMKTVVEPTGAVAPAAVLKNALGLKGKKICAVISGGNIDPALLGKLFV
ncbi:MAG TPA: threonine/serine dehydratase [Bacteroidota bacterium]|nr:threonine/serine dehydratase [Bacteroidota bacterium]